MTNLQINYSLDETIQEAQRVLQLESFALKTLANHLDDQFTAVVDCLHALKGRIIVSGMGKSGHVGSKIAATLSSTGSTAYFVHPAEASHGDMGMITPEDAVIALSYSGETAELADLANYTRRFSVPLIAITSKANSALSKAADYVLLLPQVEEACPHRLAPTTSTTMMLALGDAIALCLMAKKEFTSEAFKIFHPGGALGKRLIKVSDIMHGPEAVPLIQSTALMHEAILVMTEKRLGCVGVVEGKKLVGIITDGDLRRHLAPAILETPVTEIMTKDPKIVSPDALAVKALNMLSSFNITTLFVVGSEVQGILHLHDCLKAGLA